jgi:hypothetical protein
LEYGSASYGQRYRCEELWASRRNQPALSGDIRIVQKMHNLVADESKMVAVLGLP